jgi:anthranilate synthase/aminodeoxychorismate synthase-like glutamine amidotransferase
MECVPKNRDVLIIDHLDSFTHNLLQIIGGLGLRVDVVRYDNLKQPTLFPLPRFLILSPGPGSPKDYPLSLSVLREAITLGLPVLGICLGHQLIAHFFGMPVVGLGKIIHGKASRIFHDKKGLFVGIEQGFMAGRYHSLFADCDDKNAFLTRSAWTEDGITMGIRHKELPIEGIQFHPESVLTPCGEKILRNFFEYERGAHVVA